MSTSYQLIFETGSTRDSTFDALAAIPLANRIRESVVVFRAPEFASNADYDIAAEKKDATIIVVEINFKSPALKAAILSALHNCAFKCADSEDVEDVHDFTRILCGAHPVVMSNDYSVGEQYLSDSGTPSRQSAIPP